MVNESGLETSSVLPALRSSPEIAALVSWSSSTQGQGSSGGGPTRRAGGLFERDRYVTPARISDQIRTAQHAVENDDVVGNVADATEALAFRDVIVQCEDEDETNIWAQVAEDLDLEARMREIWREEFSHSNGVIATWWGTKTYKVQGKTKGGNERRKRFEDLKVPLGVSVLDPLKVVPVGNFLFGQERLCYIANRGETDAIESFLARKEGSQLDPSGPEPDADQVISQWITGKYEPKGRERNDLGQLGVDVSHLYTLNPKRVYRQTATRPQYQRHAAVRMKRVFEILDQKQQLRQMDRAHLIGATRFIIVVTKGSDAQPAQQAELDNLNVAVRNLGTVPILIGDHRLSVSIVSPSTDTTLDTARYLGVDVRIAASLYGMFITSTGGKGDDSVKLTKVVARGLEARRDAQRRNMMREVFIQAYEANESLTSRPSMLFAPRRIALDFDPNLAAFLQDLRDRGDLSRESILSEIDYDQADEARKREIEAERYDKIFQTSVPFAAAPGPDAPKTITPPGQPGPTDPKAGGRKLGGNRRGGGRAPGTGQGKPARKPTARPAAASESDDSEPKKED